MVRQRVRLPGWHEQALGVLAKAEADGVRMLEAALPAIADSKLRRIFLKHIEDEKRHTQGFTDLYRAYFPNAELPASTHTAVSTNVLEFLAFLEITEVRGEQMIENYRELYAKYPDVQAFMASVLRDERYHASYLHAQLDGLASQGLENDVRAARRAALAIDTQGFISQIFSFVRVVPRLLWHALRAPSASRVSQT